MTRELDSFLMMVKKQLIVMTRYPLQFAASFFQIFVIISMFTLGILVFAQGGPSAGTGGAAQAGPLTMYGFVLFMFLSDSIWSMGYGIREEHYQGTLESLYLTPASKFASLVSRVVVTLVWTGSLSIVAVLFTQLFIGRLPFHNLALAGFLLAMALSGTFGFGFAFAAYTLLVKESAMTTANFLQFALMIVCAMFFPFSTLPEPVQWIARVIPFSYAVDIFRSTLMGYPPGFPELAPREVEIVIVTLFGILMPYVGYRAYQWAEERARRGGSLAEF